MLKTGPNASKYQDIINTYTTAFKNNELNVAAKSLSGLNLDTDAGKQLQAGIGSMYHQYGSNSGLAKDVAGQVNAMLANGNPQGAIDYVRGSMIGKKYAERASDIIDGIKSYADTQGVKVNVPKSDFAFKDKKSYDEYVAKLDAYMQDSKHGYSNEERIGRLKDLQDAVGTKFGETTKISTPAIGQSLQDRIAQQTAISKNNSDSFAQETYQHPIDLMQYAYAQKKADAQVQNLTMQQDYAKNVTELQRLKADAANIDPKQKVKVNATADRIEEMERKMSLMKQKIDTNNGIQRLGLPLLD
jgi:hypothetical protein